MVEVPTISLLFTLFLVLVAEFFNGWTDAPNAVAAAVATRVLPPDKAIWIAAGANLLGLLPALIIGAEVAKTVGTGIVRPDVISLEAIDAAMLAIIAWAGLSAYIGLPVSKSHATVAALLGVGFAIGGFDALLGAGWIKVAKGVGIAIFLGVSLAWIATKLVKTAGWHKSISNERWTLYQQITVVLVSMCHGFGDGLKFVGVFTLVLVLGGQLPAFVVQPWVIILCAACMGAGTLCGGRRIIKRLDTMVNSRKDDDEDGGHGVSYKPYQGVCTELTAAILIGTAAVMGFPMSTTHTVVSGAVGAKAAVKWKKVDWPTARIVLGGWILTIIVCPIIAYLFVNLIQLL